MNRFLILSWVVVFMVLECQWNQNSGSEPIETNNAAVSVPFIRVPDFDVRKEMNIDQSIVKWKGTKLMGTGSHEGTVKFLDGNILLSGDRLVGGEFTVDMTSIYITDIPLSDPVPRKNLTTHLNTDFLTKRFPAAAFVITEVNYKDQKTMTIQGNMTIRGITNPLTLVGTEIREGKEYMSEFSFNRFDWNIGEDGSWLEKKLVDNKVTIQVKIELKD